MVRVFIALFKINFIVKVVQSYCSSISISISSLIHKKPLFILQTCFIKCTFPRNYTTII